MLDETPHALARVVLESVGDVEDALQLVLLHARLYYLSLLVVASLVHEYVHLLVTVTWKPDDIFEHFFECFGYE